MRSRAGTLGRGLGVRIEAEGWSWGRHRRLDERLRAQVLAMKSAGKTIREIAVAMKVPKSTVARELSQKAPARRAS